ncbi:hypothetical protein ACFC0X_21280 [Paenibacillus chitinolyticus]|uniref:hypothetical protein n=1 Tax=Paenibacillus chitinolyticus TaxID=79263 RepID=UPI0035DF88A2
MKLNKMVHKQTIILTLLAGLLLISSLYYLFIYNSVKDTIINTSGVYASFESEDELFNSAELIVSGSTNQSFEERKKMITTFSVTNAIQDFYTITDFQVEHVIKGNLTPKTTIQVGEPISYFQGLTGKSKITREDYTELKKSSNYLLFLKKNSEGLYFIMNAEFGKYNTDHTDADDEKYAPKQTFREQMIQDKTYAPLKLDR